MIILGKRHELKDISTIKMLMEKITDDESLHSLAWWNISHGCLDSLKYMVSNSTKFFNRYFCGDFRITTEHVISRGHFEMLEYLLTKWSGLNLNKIMVHHIYDTFNRYQSECVRLQMIQTFVKAGADIHTKDDNILTHHSDMFTIVKYLIENGADIHARNDYVLRRAVHLDNMEMVKYLVEKGASVKNGDALQTAVGTGNIEMIKILLANGSIIQPDVKENIQKEIDLRMEILSVLNSDQ